MENTLQGFFKPKSIAVVGASKDSQKIGHAALKNILISDYECNLYPINPHEKTILGVPCYKNLNDVKKSIDLVLISVPAKIVPAIMRDCVKKQVKNIIIISSGFSEIGNHALEEEIANIIKGKNIRVLGPNTMGYKNASDGLDASFVFGVPRKGNLSLISQSGALGIGMIYLANNEFVGVSKIIGVGNKLDIDDDDLIDYFSQDDDTKVIGLYIEAVKNGRQFMNSIKACNKPVLVVKAGRSGAGARATASHTGSMVGSREVWEGLLRQAGAIQVHTLEELIDIAVTFRFMRLPRGRRMAMVAGGGGASVLATDTSVASGFTMPAVPGAVAEEIRRSLPTEAGAVVSNPVELNMSPESSYTIASSLLKADAYDMLLGHCVFGQPPWPVFNPWYDLVCDTVTSVHRDVDKPVAIILESDVPGESEWYLGLEGRYWEAGIPVYHSVAGACRAIDRFMRHRQARGTAGGR